MRTFHRLLPVALTALVAFAAGCGLKGTVKPNSPPETTIFVQGAVDTVNHVVHLYWFGSDVDGTVTGYQIRMLNPVQPAETAWVYTTRTDSVFTLQAPGGYTAPRFEVRAIDNLNQVDPTPAVEDFQFSNQPPTVRFVQKPALTDTTFASVSVTWTAADIDGDPNQISFRLWLDGQSADPINTMDRAFTIPTSRFTSGPYASRYRRLYIQPIDDGGRLGAIDSVTWFVRSPVPDSTKRARLLIVDDVLSSEPSNTATDNLFNTVTATKLPAGTFSVLRLRTPLIWSTPKDVEQTFKLFDAVVWYRGIVTSFPSNLRNFSDGITAYLDGGGKMYVEGLNLTSSTNITGAFSLGFVDKYLDVDYQFQNYGATDSVVTWGTVLGSKIYSTTLNDSLIARAIVTNLRGMRPRVASAVLLEAPVGNLTPSNTTPMAVAVNVPQRNGGRLVFNTYPLVISTVASTNPPFPARAQAVLGKIYDLLGLQDP